jgi:predicted O-methyltransferase YrrM
MRFFPHAETTMLFLSFAAALVTAMGMLRADLGRRKIAANGYVVGGVAGIAAGAGWYLFFDLGWAPVATLLGWLLALVLYARWAKASPLEMLDAGSPATAAAFATLMLCFFLILARISDNALASLMPFGLLYQSLIWAAITAFLWRMGKRASLGPRPKGEIFSIFLMILGLNLLVLSFMSPHASVSAGLSREQFGSLGVFVIGALLLGGVLTRHHTLSKEHRILEHTAARGSVVQPEYRKPTPECPHPERWRMYDSMTAEVEVLEFLRTLVTTIKPELVVETGTFLGISTLHIAEGLKQNGFGRVITCEFDAKVYEEARKRFAASELDEWIELRNESSLEIQIDGRIDLLYCDSDMPLREQEVRRFLPQMNPNGLIVLHDASSDLKIVREGALKLEREGLISVVFLPTPRGLVVAQKREGRA